MQVYKQVYKPKYGGGKRIRTGTVSWSFYGLFKEHWDHHVMVFASSCSQLDVSDWKILRSRGFFYGLLLLYFTKKKKGLKPYISKIFFRAASKVFSIFITSYIVTKNECRDTEICKLPAELIVVLDHLSFFASASVFSTSFFRSSLNVFQCTCWPDRG